MTVYVRLVDIDGEVVDVAAIATSEWPDQIIRPRVPMGIFTAPGEITGDLYQHEGGGNYRRVSPL